MKIDWAPARVLNFKIIMRLNFHWRSTITHATHVLNKNSNILGRSRDLVKVIVHIIRNCS